MERADGGRGFGIVMPHFYQNWTNIELRRLILNGIVWTAKMGVPAGGVETLEPNLQDFKPELMQPTSSPAAASLPQKVAGNLSPQVAPGH